MYIFDFKLKLVVYLSNQTGREMRKYWIIRVFVLVVVTVLLYACGQKGVDVPELLSADSLMEEHPDSALVILEGLKNTEDFSSESKAFYCLLLTEAQDKNYKVHESDSIIRIAVDYYDKSDDLLHKAKSWFYWGRVSQDLLRSEKALDCYLKALPFAEKGRFYKLVGLIYNFSGNLYRKLNMYDKALPALEKSCFYYEKAHDTLNLPYGIRDVGRVYMFKKNFDSAFFLYNRAIYLAEKYDLKMVKSTTMNDLGALYRTLGNYPNAIIMIKESLHDKKEHEKYSSYLSLARLYFELNQLDSVDYYLEKASPSPSVYVHEGICKYRYKLAVIKEKYEKAIEYNEKYNILKDSVNKYQQKEKILGLIYQYKQLEIEQEMKQKAAHERFIYLCCIFVLLSITAVGFLLYIRYRWSHEQILRLKEKRIQQEKELRLQSLEQIEHNRQLIENNKLMLVSKEHDLEIAQRELLVYNTNLLKVENELITLKREEEAFRNKLFSQTELYEKIRVAGVDSRKKDVVCSPFRQKDFPVLIVELNNLYDEFTVRLSKAYPKLKKRDIEICCLVKAGAKTGNVANIIAMTPNAVTKKKRQILEKMEVVDENVTLDQFLSKF